MITLTPMMPPRDDAARKNTHPSDKAMQVMLIAAWICAALCLVGVIYGGSLKAQDYRATSAKVACP
ncbi:hypothetical protein [Rhizobium skierniewicense]|uniref:hypothetical protein n=1 Tax=Rhizobium skierniewicense TaxID=984260 RepID=UPI0015733989|nr:hypothetical protein [Rhizobium skierniewicense]NTF32333.1 hypothetical protein [Rhizobium skierniewicense]